MTFAERVYDQLRKVPRGRVTTYKLLAEALGTRAYRAVGQALKNNPYAPEVPCHRVVKSDGKIGGFMGEKTGASVMKKEKMLKDEGIVIVKGVVSDLENVMMTL